jgi:rubredoxin
LVQVCVWDNATLFRRLVSIMSDSAAPAIAYRTWMCVVCGFIYDEAQGLPEDGIEPGTRWEEVPDTWTCPDCGVSKEDFELMV